MIQYTESYRVTRGKGRGVGRRQQEPYKLCTSIKTVIACHHVRVSEKWDEG